jgi:hypothetical protein
MTDVAGPVALLIRPSITPVTVPDAFPVVSVNEKSNVSACAGADAIMAAAAATVTKSFFILASQREL